MGIYHSKSIVFYYQDDEPVILYVVKRKLGTIDKVIIAKLRRSVGYSKLFVESIEDIPHYCQLNDIIDMIKLCNDHVVVKKSLFSTNLRYTYVF